jgi:hypothetical protein
MEIRRADGAAERVKPSEGLGRAGEAGPPSTVG